MHQQLHPPTRGGTTFQPASQPPDSQPGVPKLLPKLVNKTSHPHLSSAERAKRNNEHRRAYPGVRLWFESGEMDTEGVWAISRAQSESTHAETDE